MVQEQTTTPSRGARHLLATSCALAGCALAGGGGLLWLAWSGGGLVRWEPLLPVALLGALCGLLAARLLPPRRMAAPAWLRLCMHCHAVNPDAEQTPLSREWMPVDQYLEKVLGSQVSHGICPHCLQEHYGQHIPAPRSGQG